MVDPTCPILLIPDKDDEEGGDCIFQISTGKTGSMDQVGALQSGYLFNTRRCVAPPRQVTPPKETLWQRTRRFILWPLTVLSSKFSGRSTKSRRTGVTIHHPRTRASV
jgi:hypothetical protein